MLKPVCLFTAGRRMVMETIDKVISALGAADIDARLEELLVDGILYAFQEQVGGARLHRLCIATVARHVTNNLVTGEA